jgi:hypothetical protein
MRLHCEHILQIGIDDLWAHFTTPEYERLMAKALSLRQYKELEARPGDREDYRKVLVSPEVPETFSSLLKKVSKDASADYVEEQWKSKSERRLRWKSTPAFLPDRVKIEGDLRFEGIGQAQTKRVLEGVVEVKLIGLGGLLEKAIVKSTLESYDKSAQFAGNFAREHLAKRPG